jgi:hypothetical protein
MQKRVEFIVQSVLYWPLTVSSFKRQLYHFSTSAIYKYKSKYLHLAAKWPPMNDNVPQQDDELSFKDFKNQLQQLRLFLRSILNLVGHNIRRYYLLMIPLLIIFAAFGYKQYKDSKVFEAKASFVYIELQKKTYGEMLDKLQDMIEAKSYNRVAEALAIPLDEAKSIVSISAQNIYGSKLSEDITEKNKLFYVNVQSANSKVFDSLQYSIEHYLNNNVLVKELIASRTKILQQKIAYQKAELIMLDSMKVAYTKSLGQSSGTAYPVVSQFDPVHMYEKGEKLVHDIASMQGLLDDYRAVQTQDRFLVTESPVGKSVIATIVKYFAFFLLSCIGLFFLLSIFRK